MGDFPLFYYKIFPTNWYFKKLASKNILEFNLDEKYFYIYFVFQSTLL